MRDRLIELFYENNVRCNQTIEGLADDVYSMFSDCIIPPCKVGDTVYEVQPIRKRIQAYKVTTIKYNGNFWWFTWIVKDRKDWYGNVEGFNDSQIGKTVFLTKEEAERALKGGEG